MEWALRRIAVGFAVMTAVTAPFAVAVWLFGPPGVVTLALAGGLVLFAFGIGDSFLEGRP